MTDLVYLGFNRLEFTRKSFETMLVTTDWKLLDRLIVYDDGSKDGTREYLEEQARNAPVEALFMPTVELGPVGIMVDYLSRNQKDGLFIKIDNDVMLPPNWLQEGLDLLGKDPRIDLLGIEAIVPHGPGPRSFTESEYIGGIGFMRQRVFSHCSPTPRGRFGFTQWQITHPGVRKGWITPAVPVCLLNLVPFEPWISLSKQYVANGWQRDWPAPYSAESHALWDWWAG